MYGMVNEAIRKMMIETSNIETWKGICENIGIGHDPFESFKQYSDELTGQLVGQIAKVTNQPAEDILKSFGRYWIQHASQSEYSSVMESFATTPEELLEALDRLHTRLEMTFDDLQAPSFRVTHLTDGELLVHYNSERDLPLEPFVEGLIEGIYHKFDQHCKVEQRPNDSKDRALFYVKRLNKEQ